MDDDYKKSTTQAQLYGHMVVMTKGNATLFRNVATPCNPLGGIATGCNSKRKSATGVALVSK